MNCILTDYKIATKKNIFIFLNQIILCSLLLICCVSINVPKKEIYTVRDYISYKISGMSYYELEMRLTSSQQQFFNENFFENKRNRYNRKLNDDFRKYNTMVQKINQELQRLLYRYTLDDVVDNFYDWAVKNYKN
jgi:cell shape-determining protein MreC